MSVLNLYYSTYTDLVSCYMDAERQAIVSAYRTLYRTGLHAVQYAKPQRYVLKKILEGAFRKSPASDFDRLRIGNTVLFLENASRARGLEHKILKNLMHVRWWEQQMETRYLGYDHLKLMLFPLYLIVLRRSKSNHIIPWNSRLRKEGYENFNNILNMLNDSLHMALR